MGISTVTVETAYGKLEAEGYIFSRPKRGYYVSEIDLEGLGAPLPVRTDLPSPDGEEEKGADRPLYDLSGSAVRPDLFPFTAWARCIRSVMAERDPELLERPPGQGLPALRRAIAATGYEPGAVRSEPAKKGLFGWR
jgi:GntR family transcriptional regulator/MocR family aminotransferase